MSFFSGRRQTDEGESTDKAQTPRPLPAQPVGFETILGASAVLEGTLSSSGNVRLDGTFTGTLDINGNVLVGETAQINADIEARNISIAGAVRGNVTGNKVQLLRTGRIWGDISATALTTEEGAFIDGKIAMTNHEVNRQLKAQNEPEALEAASQSEDEVSAQPDMHEEPSEESEEFTPNPEADTAQTDVEEETPSSTSQ